MNEITNKSYWKTLIGMVLLFAMVTMAHVLFNGSDEEALRILIRYSAKISAILFSIAFSISTIHYFLRKKQTAVLLRKRPHLGLAFVVSHSYHLFFLICLQQMIHPVFTLAKTSSLLAGGTAYFFMYLMAITTFNPVKQKLSKKTWKMLHLLGGYWIWGIFFNSYLKNVINKDRYHLLLILLSLVLILRLAQFIHKKTKVS